MTPQERAEKIWHQLQVLALSHTEVEFIKDQIEEAEREARIEALCDENPEISKELEEAYIKIKLDDNSFHLTWDALDVVKKSNYAEGFRAGQLSLDELVEISDENNKLVHKAYKSGFNAAREKARGLIDKLLTHHHHIFDGGLTICSAPEFSGDCIAQRIGEMEP